MASFCAGESKEWFEQFVTKDRRWGCFQCIDCLFVFCSKWWTQPSYWVSERSMKLAESASDNVTFSCDVISLICFWSGARRRGTHQEEFIVPNILNFLRRYTNSISYLIYSQTLVTHHHVVNTFNVFLWWLYLQDAQTLGHLQDSSFPSQIQLPTFAQLI